MLDLDDHYQSILDAPDTLPPLFPTETNSPAISLADEPCTFLLCWWGYGLALGFRGEEESVNRCYNWAHNTRVTHGRLMHVYERSARGISYVFAKDMDSLKRGLMAQFRAEAILRRELAPVVDRYEDAPATLPDEDETTLGAGPVLEYDEPRLNSLATQRAEAFLADRILYCNFLGSMPTSVAQTYDVSQPRTFNVGED